MEVAGSREEGPKTTVPWRSGGPKTSIKLPHRQVVSVPTETALAAAVVSYDSTLTWEYIWRFVFIIFYTVLGIELPRTFAGKAPSCTLKWIGIKKADPRTCRFGSGNHGA